MSVTQAAGKAAANEQAAKCAARALEDAFAQHQAELLGTLFYPVSYTHLTLPTNREV